MTGETAFDVPKRPGWGLSAVLCVIAAQLVLILASCQPEHVPMAARTAPESR